MTKKVGIAGDIYPVKDVLREKLNGSWSKAKRRWTVPEELAEQAHRFVREHAAQKREDLAAIEARQREEWRALRGAENAAEEAARAAQCRAQAERTIAEAPVKARLRDSIASAAVFEEVEHKHVAGLSCSPLSVSLVDLKSGVAVDIDRFCRKESRQTSRRVTITMQVPVVAGAKTSCATTGTAPARDLDAVTRRGGGAGRQPGAGWPFASPHRTEVCTRFCF